MKKTILYAIAALGLMTGTTGCSDFGSTNIDPEHLTSENMDYRLLFTGVQVSVSGTEWEVWRNGLIYSSTMMQHTASTRDMWNGDKYTYSADYNSAYWDRYTGGIRNLFEVLHAWKDNAEYANEYQMTRILKVMLFHRMTDMYGDIPYSEAGQGFFQQLGYPKYDDQQSIYMDMLKELEEAGQALDPSKTNQIGDADILYKGNAAKWKKFSYSLMLRLAMRLSKVDPATAQTWVNTAVKGGLFASNEESAIISHAEADVNKDSSEAYGKVFSHSDPDAYRMGETFINMLKNTNDPRLPLIATVCENPKYQWSSGMFEYGDTTATKQLGMPNGYDELGTEFDISKASNWPGNKNLYSVACRYTYGRPDAPTFLVTNAENQFLLAEAAYRGWVSGSAKEYYNAGVKAAMEQFRAFSNAPLIGENRISQYLAENPFDESKALEQINVQYYINTFADEYETFANWRRTGYPVLKPVNIGYPGNVTNGTIPRRFTYPLGESTVNTNNYQAAISKLKDGDAMTSRVWWDKE